METTHKFPRQEFPCELESLRQIHCSAHHRHHSVNGINASDRRETGSTSEAEDIKSVYSVPAAVGPASSGRRTPPPPCIDRKETARISELGPRLAGYLEMNPLFIVRREDHHCETTAARPGSPEVVIIPLSPHSISSPPHVTRDGQSCCRMRKRVVIVPIFVIANIVVFIITMYRNDCPAHQTEYRCILPGLKRFSFQPLSQNPLLGPSSNTLLRMGALESELVTSGREGWRLVSCIWLHAGVFHLLLNMLGLLTLGLQMEQEFGFLKLGFVYLIAGFGGSLLSALFLRLTISVGASGALFGLMGALLSELLVNWSHHERSWFTLSQLVVLFIINLALGKMPHVDNYAHLGGCISGILLGFILLQRPPLTWPTQPVGIITTGTPAPAAPGIPAHEFTASAPAIASQRHHYEFDHQLIQREMDQRYHVHSRLQQHHQQHHHNQHHQQQHLQPYQPPSRPWRIYSLPKYKFVIWVIALNLLVVLYVVALIMLFRGVDVRKKCKWCRQLLKQ
ncbi:RHOMBOID-like protein 2 [Selaginella moellendorffii]|uniref:RHOMBOID-like protein 2 n=1 Tax=Selaginella moellendorffii TaxID=88036 RepID=UPI000D1D0DC2|nr:RHOMBOID-like protein 2 [Selaginella moellendorffii]|eukprot:XP_024537182.1 RHOMBOID-like protein 2 [Selaginella moellendorffii]